MKEEKYTCPTCGKDYLAIFLAAPVNHNCFQCYNSTCSTKKK